MGNDSGTDQPGTMMEMLTGGSEAFSSCTGEFVP